MSTADGLAHGLPQRMPRSPQPGRHRKPEQLVAPEGAPALVLAVPGTPDASVRSLAEEVVSIARSEMPGLNAWIGYIDAEADQGEDFPSLAAVLAWVTADRAERAERTGAELPDGPSAIVVPLLPGPDAAVTRRITQAIADSKAPVELTDVLGPHPLLAEGVHVRLSEAGLSRADRARLFTVSTAADGIILATSGGEEAVQSAGITGMLLSARLAVPVMAAALDSVGAVARIAEQLRAAGATQLALAPYVIGPELPEGLLGAAEREAACTAAEPLGAYPAVGKLVLTQYAGALGIRSAQLAVHAQA
ncbi:sirohydrochlorin chelatase [Streptomyces polyrhachis]|uniref:Sirohydrochlorin chelatase n=1 Tax=Streptomyces polyrhachis TaxID=1282885 RepID=A0ABW2GA34_9ACTN